QPISAGDHVLTVDTPKSPHQPTSMSLTVDPGHTYAFTATRGRTTLYLCNDRVVLPRQAGRNPSSGLRNAFFGGSIAQNRLRFGNECASHSSSHGNAPVTVPAKSKCSTTSGTLLKLSATKIRAR